MSSGQTVVESIPGLVAFWDFSEPTGGPWVSKAGVATFTLVNEASSGVTRVEGGLFSGFSARFNGVNDRLIIPAANVGQLNIAQTYGNNVTVVAWMRKRGINNSFVAGMWQETNEDPRRQYGLFASLPTYGGADQVCGHVSKTGDSSPSIPFSRDYSASGSIIPINEFRTVGFTYNGAEARSYYEGRMESRAVYTEPGAPNGEGLTYAKNPYLFDLGLNNTTVSDFTVGAVNLSSGWGNHLNGDIAGLAIYSRALTDAEMRLLHSIAIENNVYANFDFTPPTLGELGGRRPDDFGWRAVAQSTAVETTTINVTENFRVRRINSPNVFMARGPGTNGPTTGPGFLWIDNNLGISISDIAQFSVESNNGSSSDVIRFAVKIGSNWYASESGLSVPNDGLTRTANDWTNSVILSQNVSIAAAGWRDLTLNVGTSLARAGAIRTEDLPAGEITGFGLYSDATPVNNIRLRHFKIIKNAAITLSVDSMSLSMAMESPVLAQPNQLSVNSLMLSATLESPALSLNLSLAPDSIWLSSLLDHVALTQSHLLTVDDLTQSISLDNVTITVAGQVVGPGILTIGIMPEYFNRYFGPTPVFDIGDSRTFTASLLNKLGLADDPSVLTVQVIEPDGVVTEYAYPEDDEVSRVDQGIYSVDVLFTQKGRHQIKFIGSGDLVSAETIEVFIRG